MKAAVPFNLEEGPAIAVDEIRINGYSTWFVLTMNEILIDGWGAMKFMEQLISLFLSVVTWTIRKSKSRQL
ncbi:long-chain-fatty-acid-CoA ligase [Cutibacterium acnes JCM 18916]|nr:long-chain-fatty-acid-CoA ligase [Cutibacterium acnes JCM 18916]